MAVPLGHKNHTYKIVASDTFKEFNIKGDDYKKTSNAVLSKNGKVFYGIWKPVSGEYKLPKGVEFVEKKAFIILTTVLLS